MKRSPGAGPRMVSFELAGALTSALALPAAAAADPNGDGVSPVCDEAYYATLDYYGNLTEGSVVKSYTLHGASTLIDYGTYDEVVNLTDSSVPVSGEGGSTSFQFTGSVPDHFYFEGKTKQPFQELPWTVTLRYTLNGVPVKAEELAGRISALGAKATPCESVADGVARAIAAEGPEGVACALGSLYMSGEVRACFQTGKD